MGGGPDLNHHLRPKTSAAQQNSTAAARLTLSALQQRLPNGLMENFNLTRLLTSNNWSRPMVMSLLYRDPSAPARDPQQIFRERIPNLRTPAAPTVRLQDPLRATLYRQPDHFYEPAELMLLGFKVEDEFLTKGSLDQRRSWGHPSMVPQEPRILRPSFWLRQLAWFFSTVQ